MAISRINAISATATAPAADDYMPVDGAVSGTRKLRTGDMARVTETYSAIAPSAGVVTVDLSASTVFNVNWNANITSFTISNATAARVNSFTLFMKQDGTGSRTVAWSFTGCTVKWPGNTAPTMTTTANKTDVVAFQTNDGGTTYYGFVGGQAYP